MNERKGTTRRTLAALWREATYEDREGIAWLYPRDEGWAPVSWPEAAARVEAIANGLLALEIGHGDRVAILGSTSVEWAALDFALLSIGAVVVPIYPTSSASECEYILGDAGVSVAFVENSRLKELETLTGVVAGLEQVVSLSDLDAIADRGRAFAADAPAALAEAVEAVREDDLLTCIYTSGTTGPPKGCLLTNRSYFAMATMLAELPDFVRPGDRTVLFLPLAHNFGRLVHFTAAKVGYTVAFCSDVGELRSALEAVRPHFLPSVPRIYEKLQESIQSQLEQSTGIRRRVANWAVRVGRAASEREQQGRSPSPALAFQHRVADRLVLSKVRARLGGELRFAISGGAPISVDLLEFFHAFGVLILEGYGLTECMTGAINQPRAFRFGTVGKPFPGGAVRLAADGEVLLSGDAVFSGYHNKPEATAEALNADGWVHTGDIGEFDSDGFLRITDRKKDLIATSAGKKISPQLLAGLLTSSKLISQALIVGDRRPYIVALLTLDPEDLGGWARSRGLDPTAPGLAGSAEVHQFVAAAVERANCELARPEQIKRFAVLPREFSAEDGEVTPTLKLRRRVCEQHFAAEIAALYSGAGASG